MYKLSWLPQHDFNLLSLSFRQQILLTVTGPQGNEDSHKCRIERASFRLRPLTGFFTDSSMAANAS